MDEKNPKVSVIMPIYNSEMYLEECLSSIINQTLEDIEIICINDGSTDNSLNILNKFAKKDRRIKVIDKPNTGYGHSMNVGLDTASGEYIGIVESDDFIKPHMYETLYNVAVKYDLDIIRADFEQFVDVNNERVFKYVPLSKDKQYYNKIINPYETLEVFTFSMNNWSGIYKNKFIKKNKIRHNETPGASFQDNGFWFQAFCLAKRIYFIDTPLYQVRRDNPNSSVKSKEKVFCACEEYDFIRTFLDKNPDLKSRFIYVYSLKRFHNYMFTLRRISEEYRPIFIKRFSVDFRKAFENNELDKKLFPDKDWEKLMMIINEPDKFYSKFQEIEKLRVKGNKPGLPKRISHFLYRILCCYKEYGLRYTLKKAFNKILRK